MDLSVVLITHNEEANLGRTLASVKPLVRDGQGEIIVVDSGSNRPDSIVAPGADPQLIRLAVLGGDRLAVDHDGNLVITAGQRGLTLLKPGIYQDLAGRRLAVEGRYVIDGAIAAGRGGQRVRFEIASYDRRRTLVIDPQLTLVYSTYLGGTGLDDGFGNRRGF